MSYSRNRPALRTERSNGLSVNGSVTRGGGGRVSHRRVTGESDWRDDLEEKNSPIDYR